MTDNANNNNNKLTVSPENAPAVWGDRQEVAAVAKRLRAMLPNGAKLTEGQLFAAAQYAQLTGLNPFSKGFYALPDGGITDHYAALVNWAQSKEPYNDKYFPLSAAEKEAEGIEAGAEAWKCYIIKDSRQSILLQYLQAGLSLPDALELVATKGIGFVTEGDKVNKFGKILSPPKNWTWDRVAQKRALRSALALSHGAPTIGEMAALSWQVGSVETEPADWQDAPPHIANDRQLSERYAQAQALARQQAQADQEMTAKQHRDRLAQNIEVMRGPADEPIGEEPEESPEERFYQTIAAEIPYYRHAHHVKNTVAKMGLEYDPADEAGLTAQLQTHAAAKADEAAAGGQVKLFDESNDDQAGPGAAYAD